jgi:hypothetical protein
MGCLTPSGVRSIRKGLGGCLKLRRETRWDASEAFVAFRVSVSRRALMAVLLMGAMAYWSAICIVLLIVRMMRLSTLIALLSDVLQGDSDVLGPGE